MAKTLRKQAKAKLIAGKLAELAKSISTTSDPDKHHGDFAALAKDFTSLHAEGRTGAASIIAAFESWENRKARGRPLLIPTGLKIIDDKTGGLPPKLCAFVGEPGIGKSAMLATIIEQQLLAGLKVVIFSLEDGDEWFVKRQLARRLGMKVRDVFSKEFIDGDKTQDAAQEMASLYKNLWVVTKQQARTAQDIIRISTQLVSQKEYQVIYVDNMTAVRHETRDKFEQSNAAVGRSYENFAEFADIFRIPLVVLAHTTRKYQDRTAGKGPPIISDIAETANADRYIRLALSFWKKKQCFRASVTKHNEGDPEATFEFEMHREAALVDAERGRTVDLAYEAREERKEKAARAMESQVVKNLERKALTDKLKPKKPPKEAPPPPEEVEQPDMFSEVG